MSNDDDDDGGDNDAAGRGRWVREVVGRGAMLVLALALLAGAAALAYFGWMALAADYGAGGSSWPGPRDLAVPLLAWAAAAGLGWAGLFLGKRAVVPAHWDEPVQAPRLWDNPDADSASNWDDLL